MSPCLAPCPQAQSKCRLLCLAYTATFLPTAGEMCQMWLLTALGMAVAIFWNRWEKERKKVPWQEQDQTRTLPRPGSGTPLPTPGMPRLCVRGSVGSWQEGAGKQGSQQSQGCLLL